MALIIAGTSIRCKVVAEGGDLAVVEAVVAVAAVVETAPSTLMALMSQTSGKTFPRKSGKPSDTTAVSTYLVPVHKRKQARIGETPKTTRHEMSARLTRRVDSKLFQMQMAAMQMRKARQMLMAIKGARLDQSLDEVGTPSRV